MQIDPSEKLDPEVEDILVDIAEDFVESVSCCNFLANRISISVLVEMKPEVIFSSCITCMNLSAELAFFC